MHGITAKSACPKEVQRPHGSGSRPWAVEARGRSEIRRIIVNYLEFSRAIPSYPIYSMDIRLFSHVMYIYFDCLSKNPWGARAIIDIRQGVCALQIRAAIMARGLKLTMVAHWDTDDWLVIALAFFLAWTSPIQVSDETQPEPRLVQKCTRKQSEQLHKYWRRAQRFPAVLSSCANKDDQKGLGINYGFC